MRLGGGLISGYGQRQMEKDVVEHIPSKELGKWVNHKWQFEDNEALYREKCGEAYYKYEIEKEKHDSGISDT